METGDSMRLSLVTVVYEQELDMLKTQAKSMAFRFKPEHVQEVMVLVNDVNSLADKIDPIWFGHLRPKVRIVTRKDLGYWPAAGISGWKSQQIMKLLGVAASSADWCMVLDAKTWFIKNYDPFLIFDGVRAKFGPIVGVPEVFQPGQRYLEQLFGISDSVSIAPGGVPNLMKPSVVKDMIADIEQRTSMGFASWFEENCDFESSNGVTEFICHSVYVCYKYGGISKLYAGNQLIEPFNLADWQMDQFDSWYGSIHKSKAFTVSIQARALPLLTAEQWAKWRKFLELAGLE